MSVAWLEFLANHVVPDMRSALKLSHVISNWPWNLPEFQAHSDHEPKVP